MSRAFVRESDQEEATLALPERPVSPHPNFVTPAGLAQIQARVRELEGERQGARDRGDAAAEAHAARELRYWTQRRASARVVEPAPHPDAVRFGVRVTLRLPDGGERSFRLVGEDEADPAKGLLSWVAPLAASLIGREPGDRVPLSGGEAEILRID